MVKKNNLNDLNSVDDEIIKIKIEVKEFRHEKIRYIKRR